MSSEALACVDRQRFAGHGRNLPAPGRDLYVRRVTAKCHDPGGSPRVLLIEDDRALLQAIKFCLRAHNLRVIATSYGREGLDLAIRERPDLVVLDLLLPDMGGLEVCRELRSLHFDAPILMVTGLRPVEDRVAGLGAGADDYLLKPFDERELVARVDALLRRSRRAEAHVRCIVLGDRRVDFESRTATRGGAPLALTKTEFALLELLARARGRPVAQRDILHAIWGYSRTPETRTVDTHIWRLRKKLGDSGTDPRWLKLVPGQGYRLDAVVEVCGDA